MKPPTPLPPGLCDLPVEGSNLEGPRLGDLLSERPRLFGFLRHFG
jgi:hypothetical protein